MSPNVDLEMKSAREGFLPSLNKVVEVSQVSLPGNWFVVVVDFSLLQFSCLLLCFGAVCLLGSHRALITSLDELNISFEQS